MRYAIFDVRTGIICGEHGDLEKDRAEFFPYQKTQLNGDWKLGDVLNLETLEVIKPTVISVE